MAQKVTVALEDDLDGGPADETVRFGFEGAAYGIELSSMDARAFRAQLGISVVEVIVEGSGERERQGQLRAGVHTAVG
jgi:hypothetical protein